MHHNYSSKLQAIEQNLMNDYSTTLETQMNTMRTQISSSLEKARDRRDTLKRTNSRYITSNIILSALATLLAGMAGTIGNAQKRIYSELIFDR